MLQQLDKAYIIACLDIQGYSHYSVLPNDNPFINVKHIYFFSFGLPSMGVCGNEILGPCRRKIKESQRGSRPADCFENVIHLISVVNTVCPVIAEWKHAVLIC